jgi:hypothetical protein
MMRLSCDIYVYLGFPYYTRILKKGKFNKNDTGFRRNQCVEGFEKRVSMSLLDGSRPGLPPTRRSRLGGLGLSIVVRQGGDNFTEFLLLSFDGGSVIVQHNLFFYWYIWFTEMALVEDVR